MQYVTISFYQFFSIEDVAGQIASLQLAWKPLGVRGRIYLAKEGINAQLSLEKGQYAAWLRWKETSLFHNAPVKMQSTTEHAFEKLTIKERPQLCAFDVPIDVAKHASASLTPQEWKKRLDERDPSQVVIDVRNSYESSIGHFSGALLPPLETFREFPSYAKYLKEKMDLKKTSFLIYCTGGIRCEYYGAYLRQQGFEEVYQLAGGVVEYGNEVGSDHWIGKLFVFDDRMAVDIGSEEVIASCIHCKNPSDTHYNCANMDCNRLFTCCPACAKKMRGLCQGSCQEGRVRPFDPGKKPKPFRKLSAS